MQLWRFICIIGLAWSSSIVLAESEKEKRKAFHRLLATQKGSSDAASTGAQQPTQTHQNKVAYYQSILKDGLDPTQALIKLVQGDSFKAILDHSEIQHRILEEVPFLSAFDGFKQMAGRRLSDDETIESFGQGVENALNFAKDAFGKVKDSSHITNTLNGMMESGDPEVQELFGKYAAGDDDAIHPLQDHFIENYFTGVNGTAVRVLANDFLTSPEKRILDMPEIMEVIDQDPTASDFFRSSTARN